MLNSALIITLLGLFWVFFFLGILVLSLKGLSLVLQKFFPEKSAEEDESHASILAILKAQGLLK